MLVQSQLQSTQGRHGRRHRIAPVAERAGIAAGTVYRYFPSKTELVGALIAAIAETEIGALRRAAEAAPGPVSALAASIATFAARALRNRKLSWAVIAEPVDAAIEACSGEGRIDVLANVAGVVQFGRFETITDAEWDRVHDIDLKGPFMVMQAALPLIRACTGNIVNVSSVAGRVPQPYTTAYSAAMGGLIGRMNNYHASDGLGQHLNTVASEQLR